MMKNRRYRITSVQLREFAASLGFLLDGGLPLEEALILVGETERNQTLSKAFLSLGGLVSQGEAFSEALGKTLYPMDSLFLMMAKAGEMTGRVGFCLLSLGAFLERKLKNREVLLKALLYPSLILVLMILGLLFLMGFVIPRAMVILNQLDMVLSGTTVDLPLRLVNLQIFLVVMLMSLLLFSLGVILYRITSRERCNTLDRLIFRLTPRVWIESELYGYLSCLEVLIGGGVPLDSALEESGEAFKNPVLRWKHRCLVEGLAAGESPGRQFLESEIFPPRFGRWIAFSERVGDLAEAVVRLRRHYEENLEKTSGRLAAVVEPGMILLVGGLLFLFVLRIVVPLLSMMGGAV